MLASQNDAVYAVGFLHPQHKEYHDILHQTSHTESRAPDVQVYEMAIDTILLSFCEDCTANNETPQFAPKLLMSALGKAKKFQEQQEKRASNKTAAVVHAK